MKGRLFLLLVLFCGVAFSQSGGFYLASYQQANAGPTNLYTTANSLNPDNEANAVITTSFIDPDLTLSSQTISPVSPQDGTYYWLIDVNNTSGANDRVDVVLEGLPDNTALTVEIWAYEIVGTSYTLSLNTADGWSIGDAVNTAGTGWQKYTLTGTTDASAQKKMRIVALSGSAAGDQLGIDNAKAF